MLLILPYAPKLKFDKGPFLSLVSDPGRRPSTATTEDISAVRLMIETNKRVAYYQIRTSLGIGRERDPSPQREKENKSVPGAEERLLLPICLLSYSLLTIVCLIKTLACDMQQHAACDPPLTLEFVLPLRILIQLMVFITLIQKMKIN
ncbi:hypothetical protein EVAR_12307_1 [Eumeta japonica]|uniref:Uncharacterized protein n=1 Tax=Eumeta variegata TaxID=151549 RepID=A0A4C1TUC7_EUMVA|nr:hypothetical protein EVAR_12307_1 [Eumeta japonica]